MLLSARGGSCANSSLCLPVPITLIKVISSMSPQEGKAYYEQTGVGPLPVVLYNGMPLQREQLDPDELETVVMHKILETTSFFQRTVYLVRITCLSPIVSMVSFLG